MSLTQKELKRLVEYNPDTGVFERRLASGPRNCHKAGEVLGWFNQKSRASHMCTSLGKKKYYLHRLAFLYMTGTWPVGTVDHKNGDPTDNRWSNLRDVPQGINMQNMRKPTRCNTSGYLGVSYDRARDKFEAAIRIGDKRIRRRFATAEEAADFYIQTKRAVHIGCTI